jgi:hypothetical protein
MSLSPTATSPTTSPSVLKPIMTEPSSMCLTASYQVMAKQIRILGMGAKLPLGHNSCLNVQIEAFSACDWIAGATVHSGVYAL